MNMTPSVAPDTAAAPKLLDQVRARIRVKHYSIRTEAQYVQWIKRFIYFHDKRHPRDMGAPEVEAFLTDLAVSGGVSASTQNQALSALLFLYREVLEIVLPWLDNVTRAKPSRRLPVVLTPAEVRAVLERMDGVYGLMARLLYGTGMRLMECLRLPARRRSGCRMRWKRNIPMRRANGAGSLCSVRAATRPTRAAVRCAVITSTKSCCSGR